jgi:hypothetical protein
VIVAAPYVPQRVVYGRDKGGQDGRNVVSTTVLDALQEIRRHADVGSQILDRVARIAERL